MAYEAIAVRQAKTFALTAQSGTVALTFDSAVLAGSALVVVAAAIETTGYQTVRLSSVSGGGTWGNVTNVADAGSYSANVFSALAPNVSAGSPTVTLTLSGSFSPLANAKLSGVLFEIEKAEQSPLDKTVTGAATGGALSISTSATGLLSQSDELLILCAGGYFGEPANPAGWTSRLTQTNGTYIGAQVSTLKVTSTASVVGTVSTPAGATGSSALMLSLKADEILSGGFRYKFLLRSDTFTSADTSLEAFVWRNGDPDSAAAEKYTGLAGSATAGTLLITSGLPVGVALSDTVRAVIRQSGGTGDTSGIIAGTVEAT